jgi:hypothetical protein
VLSGLVRAGFRVGDLKHAFFAEQVVQDPDAAYEFLVAGRLDIGDLQAEHFQGKRTHERPACLRVSRLDLHPAQASDAVIPESVPFRLGRSLCFSGVLQCGGGFPAYLVRAGKHPL